MKYLVLFLLSLCFFGNTGAIDLNECRPQQLNQEECAVLPFYINYQKVICLTDIEISTRSNGKIKCNAKRVGTGSSARSYCWYPQCQLAMYNYGFNREIHPDCKCEWESRNYCKHDLDHGKKRCLKLSSYDSVQQVTCLSSREVLSKNYGSGCPFPQTHCWYSCQAEKYQSPSGEIESDCECTSSASVVTTPVNFLVLCIISVTTYLLL